jgi:hypothetical protein
MVRIQTLLILAFVALGADAPARACAPWISGSAEKEGVPAADMLVTIELADPGPFCEPATFTDYTDQNGEFSYCVGCTGTVTVTIEDESRTHVVNGYTEFGVWEIVGVPGDNDRDGLVDAEELQLLQAYAPQLRLHWTEDRLPASVGWLLPRSYLRYTHDDGCSDCEIIGRGSVTNENITEQCHRNKSGWPWCNHEGSCNPSDSYMGSGFRVGFFLQQHNEDHAGSGDHGDWVTYGHAFSRSGGGVVLQYWVFYAYNDSYLGWNHEGDWELVAVYLDAAGEVVEVKLSAHEDFTPRQPHELEWVDGTHPVVYVANGSHANYHGTTGGPLGDCLDAPFYDNCNELGVWWNTWDEQEFGGILWLGERSRHVAAANWLRYSGRWGEIGVSDDTSGPHGPAYQSGRWLDGRAAETCDNGVDDDIDGAVDEPECVPPPDFRVDEVEPAIRVDGEARRIVAWPGDSFPLRLTVQNEGGGFGGTLPVAVHLSPDIYLDDGDVLLEACCELPPMAGGSTVGPLPTRTATIPLGTPASSYRLIAVADPDDLIDEGSGGDNDNQDASLKEVRVIEEALVVENFEDGVANGFTAELGDWSVVQGSYEGIAPNGDYNDSVSLIDLAESSVVIEFDAKALAGDGAWFPYFGAILRFVDAANTLRLDVHHRADGGARLRLIGWDGGGDHVLHGQVDLPQSLATGWHHYRIEDTGCETAVFVDKTLVLEAVYATSVSNGHRGFFVNTGDHVAFDNLVIESLDTDGDDDGWDECEDCDDTRSGVNPGAAESCNNSYDDDCDGQVNEGCGGSKYDMHEDQS